MVMLMVMERVSFFHLYDHCVIILDDELIANLLSFLANGYDECPVIDSPTESGFCPCQSFYGIYVGCFNISMNVVSETFHNRTDQEIILGSFRLVVPLREQFIPADLLAHHQTKTISIECEDEVIQKLSIHPDAFRSSRNCTHQLRIETCDVSRLDFAFLTGFNNLEKFRIGHAINVHLAEWPSFPSSLLHLKTFEIMRSSGVDEWTRFPVLIQGIEELDLHDCRIGDESIDRILQWVVHSPSVNTLKILSLEYNSLTRIPRQIKLLGKLENLVLSINKIAIIERGSFFRNSSTKCDIRLGMNEIRNIEPGAFQGFATKSIYGLRGESGSFLF